MTTIAEREEREEHPSFGMVGFYRTTGNPGLGRRERFEMTFLIWWTNEADCLALACSAHGPACAVPAYITTEYASRAWQDACGRLWVAPELIAEGAPTSVNVSPVTPLTTVLGADYGGIVIRASDVGCLRDLPGVITDLNVRRVGGER